MIITSKQKTEIMNDLVDDGLYYCNNCENYFIVRNTCDGEINSFVCPCCGKYSIEDNVEPVEVED